MNLGVDWRETKMPFHVGKPLLFFLLSLRSVIKHFMMIMTFLFTSSLLHNTTISYSPVTRNSNADERLYERNQKLFLVVFTS